MSFDTMTMRDDEASLIPFSFSSNSFIDSRLLPAEMKRGRGLRKLQWETRGEGRKEKLFLFNSIMP